MDVAANLQRITSQRGVTLVELLVSMLVASIILAGVVQLMLDNRAKFRLNNEIAYLQENIRFSMEELGYELRMAGYNGCGASANVANVVNSGDVFYGGPGIEGWDGSENATEFPEQFRDKLWASAAASAPDAIIVRRLNSDNASTIDDAAPNSNSSAVIKILGNHSYPQGTILVAQNQDCSQVSIFQHTQDVDTQYIHNTGNAVSPGNCTKSMYGTGTCSDTSGLDTKNFGGGGQVSEYSSVAYYIGASSIDSTIPSLYRAKVSASSGVSGTSAEELLIGVENLQLLYGIDTDTLRDGKANRYLDADDINGAGTMDWSRVVSVRVDLLMRSLDPVWGSNSSFNFAGANYSDRMLRQRVSSTVQLRNLALVK